MSTIEQMLQVQPSKRQLNYQSLEFIGFIHFGINTFYGTEWGDGTEDPKKFNTTNLDVNQWVETLKKRWYERGYFDV